MSVLFKPQKKKKLTLIFCVAQKNYSDETLSKDEIFSITRMKEEEIDRARATWFLFAFRRVNECFNLEEIATKGFLMEMCSTISGLSHQIKLPQNFSH